MDKPRFELRILGPTELAGPVPDAGDSVVRQPKRLALLAHLALTTADGFRRRDKVIALFWPELDQSQARTYLRKALYGINEALGAEIFATRGEDEIRLDPAQCWCDAVALPRLACKDGVTKRLRSTAGTCWRGCSRRASRRSSTSGSMASGACCASRLRPPLGNAPGSRRSVGIARPRP